MTLWALLFPVAVNLSDYLWFLSTGIRPHDDSDVGVPVWFIGTLILFATGCWTREKRP